jgi:hypothetical protein
MKKQLLLVFILALSVGYVPAQEMPQTQLKLQEYYMFKDGKMFHIRNQEEIQLNGSRTLVNGNVFNPDGSYQLRNKDKEMLKNGECLDSDGTRYKNQEQAVRKLQYRAQALALEYYMYQSGKMYQYQNQERTQLEQQATLQNGTTIDPDGNMLSKNKQVRLKEGECVDTEGNRYENHQRYQEKMEQRMEKLDQDKGKKGKSD